jgi:hypothetical protein
LISKKGQIFQFLSHNGTKTTKTQENGQILGKKETNRPTDMTGVSFSIILFLNERHDRDLNMYLNVESVPVTKL